MESVRRFSQSEFKVFACRRRWWLRYADKQPKLPKVSKADERFMNSRAAKREVKAQAEEDRKRGR